MRVRREPTRRRAARLAAAVAALAPGVAVIALAAPTAARAHGTGHDVPATHAQERALRRSETRTLGPQHAAEHAAQRAALRRWSARPARERAALAARARRAATRATTDAGPADQVGRWSPTRVDLPTWAINAALLPTGKVAYWGRGALDAAYNRENSAPFYVWDPATGESEAFDPPQETIDFDGDGHADDLAPAPLFCSGQSLLPSGELYVAGGNRFYPGYGTAEGLQHASYGGWNGTYSFDPWTERWTRQPAMEHGRWYPTQVELPDGRIGIASGYDEDGNGTDNRQFDVFTPAAERGGVGTLRPSVAAERVTQGFYPHMQVLPGGRLAYVGQFRGDTRSLDPAELFPGGSPAPGSAWRDGPDTAAVARVGGSAALVPGTSRMFFLGGYGWDWVPGTEGRTFAPASRQVETTDFAAASPRWSTGAADDVPDLDRGRSYGTLVGLPDGGFAYVGGAAGFDGSDSGVGNNATEGQQELKAVALWHPGEARWRTGPAQAKWRGYHSTAVLLPDGRVLSAGDDYWGPDDQPHQGAAKPGEPQDQGEIYEPAYLFDGAQRAPRPTITSGPSSVEWGATFGLGVAEVPGRRIVRATLIAPTAVTHAVDMNRAFADLRVLDREPGRGVTLQAPSGPDVAPPGWYLLFAWDETGTPSVAHWVQVEGDAPVTPPVTPESPVATPPTDDGAPPAPAPPPGPVAVDRAGPRTAIVLPRPARGARALRLVVGADEPARIVVRSRIGAGPRRTATVRLRATRLRATVRLPLTRGQRRSLAAGRPLRVVVRVAARDTAGNGARRTVVVRLRPRRR